MEDLFKSIDEYLKNPQLDSDKRKLIVDNEAGPFHGNSGKMIAKYVESLVQ